MQRNLLSAASLFLCATTLLLLAGCTKTGNGPWSTPAPTTQIPEQQSQIQTAPVPDIAQQSNSASPVPTAAKIAILLPLTGKGSDMGQAMLNAAQLAMFDLNANSLFELIPQDTGTGAEQAITNAATSGSNLILGPLFSENTKIIAPTALQYGLNVISFSTDTTAAVGNTFLIGFMPQTQIEQILSYATTTGLNKIALIAPRNVYGDQAASTYVTFLQNRGLSNAGIIRYASGALPSESDISLLKSTGANAVLIASSAFESNKISNLLTASNLPPSSIKRLGTGLWDTTEAPKLSGLQGAWYAASSPRLRTRFEHRYFETYGVQPPRLASLAYDATALTVVLSKSGKGFGRDALTNPNGFSGIDGIFRFNQQNTTDRGLAIVEIQNGAPNVIQDAPQRF